MSATRDKLPANPRAALILQARMGSTRLPGKSLMDLVGAPLVGRILERVKRCRRVDVIVVATTHKAQDDVLADLAREYEVTVFRGAENDLVDRYYQAALAVGAHVIARLPADNPVPEPEEIDRIIAYHLESHSEFSSNLAQVFGNGYPDGLGAEVFNTAALKIIHNEVNDPERREHPHLNFFNYRTQQPVDPRFRVGTVQCPAPFRRPDLVLDVNTAEEYEFLKELYSYLYPRNPRFHITDIIEWYDSVYAKAKGI
jgi:spore coat polysaccharide biosynthesis protein SpsF